MKPKKIKQESDLPVVDEKGWSEQVIVWGWIGHRITPEVASLRKEIGEYQEYLSSTGGAFKRKTFEYPNNYKWNVSGTWYDFDKITHWCKLPKID